MLSCHRSYGQYREIPFGTSCSQWVPRESNPASRIKSPVRSRYARNPQSSITTPETPKATSESFSGWPSLKAYWALAYPGSSSWSAMPVLNVAVLLASQEDRHVRGDGR